MPDREASFAAPPAAEVPAGAEAANGGAPPRGATDEELRAGRYSRQVRFAPLGAEGQRRLGAASVLVVGVGALGASLAEHMARAGVGLVRIIDRDYVEPSNLQRQTLFDEEDARLALPKAVAAARRLRRINSGVRIEEHVADVTAASALRYAAGVDLVLDGTDNVGTRLVLNDVCYRLGVPLVYGGATGAAGMSATFVPGETACLRCLTGGEEEDGEVDSCDTAGVIAPVVELVAALQAAEALKWLAGRREALRRTWLAAELWPFAMRELRLPPPNVGCPVCGPAALAAAARPAPAVPAGSGAAEAGPPAQAAGFATARPAAMPGAAHTAEAGGAADASPRQAPQAAAVLCGRDTVQVTLERPLPADEWELALAMRGCKVMRNPYLLRAETPEGRRLVLFPDGRVLVQGTSDPAEALRMCAVYLRADG